jgi:SPP1 gp7 family putative phage head morphogenesis protein
VTVYQLSRQFKAELLLRERAGAREMLASYRVAYRAIMDELKQLTDQMEAHARAQARRLETGLEARPINTAWLLKERRLLALQGQVREQLRQFGAFAGPAIDAAKTEAALRAEDDARELAFAALGPKAAQISVSWSTLPIGAFESLVGTFGSESPVAKLFASFGIEAAAGVRSALIKGVTIGQGPRLIADAVRSVLGVPLTRALTISRTETLRSYREASIASYAANRSVVRKWRWTATKTARTCAMCLAMDGQEFDMDVPFGSHPNCRCVPVPVTVSWEEMGITGVPETAQEIESGSDWFDRQDKVTQLQVLGPAKFELFERGEIKISDLVGYRNDPEWGPVRYEKSAKSVES